MALLEIKNVNKNFGGLTAVMDFDFRIERNEIVGLIGPNGAGKTTIFNLLTGVYPADSGDIIFNEKSITKFRTHEICEEGIGRCFQIVKPFGDISVLENVLVGAFCRIDNLHDAKQRSMEVLEFVKLEHKKDALAKNLTIADKKRLEMARALATKPQLLLLDEVMAGLNPKETEDTISLVRKLRENGITLFIIEHVMRVIMTLADRVCIIHHGRKIVEGEPKIVTQDQRVIKAYLGEAYASARAK